MLPKIRRLSEQTINQIAAGEVIENPASVVKELIENAVDAGATRIHIRILGGGYQQILIADNGSGMNPEDAEACLERHATSKIEETADLMSLKTMGFRGEALAAIASISKMQLLTAEKEGAATQIDVEGGQVVRIQPAARPQGTTVEVRALFYNVPARRKFQKSVSASTAEITKVVTEQALAHPERGFELMVQEAVIFSVSGVERSATGIAKRSGELLGALFQKQVFTIHREGTCLSVQGIIGSPTVHRHNRTGQHLFVNRRPVVSPLIAYSIKDAYGTRLPIDRYPMFVLHIEILADLIDVNVHPQKREIRFRDEGAVRQQIHEAIQQEVSRAEWHQPMTLEKNPEMPWILGEMHAQELKDLEFGQGAPQHRESMFIDRSPKTDLAQISLFNEKVSYIPTLGVLGPYLLIDALSLYELQVYPTLFQVIPPEKGILLIDLQAASARIAFEQSIDRTTSQGLLCPEVISVSAEEEQLVQMHEVTLHQLGFQVRSGGKQRVMIEGIPASLESHAAGVLFKEWLAAVKEALQTGRALTYLMKLSSQFVQGRKKHFLLQEAEEIFKQLLQTSSPHTCPDGHLTMSYMSLYEIGKKFVSSRQAIGAPTAKLDGSLF